LTWWLGDAGGAIVVAPVILLIATSRQPWAAGRAREAILFAVALAVFVDGLQRVLPMSGANYPISFLCVPLLSWPALRWTPGDVDRRAHTGGRGELGHAERERTVRLDPHYGLILVQTFAGVAGITAATIARWWTKAIA
jgi:hypothetical protein